MVTVTDMKIIIERWKKGSRPLKIHDSQYGQNLVGMLEKYKETDFAMLEDPFEVTAFILLVGMLSGQDRNTRVSVHPETILPDPKMNRTMNTMSKIQIPERS
jgi:hypothetical protein